MSVRKQALEALTDILDRGAYANLRLKEIKAEQRDMRFISALVYETLDHLYYIDYMLQAFAKGKQKPIIRMILRMGACELLFMRTPAFTVCDESVKLTKRIGKGMLSGYVNGVLRALANGLSNLPALPKDAAQRLSVQYSWPLFIVERLIARFQEEETERLLSAKLPHMQIRAQHPFRAQDMAHMLNMRGIEYTIGRFDANCFSLTSGFDIANDPLFLEGSITAQSESAMLVCRACGDVKGKRVLDACAAPGGKSAYLYSLAEEDIALHAWEMHTHRKTLLDKTFERLHIDVQTQLQDAAEYRSEYEQAFDIVLIDAPCSGLGVSKPDIRYRQTPEGIMELAALQKRILHTCAHYVKPGGALIYATCTISYEENEGQIAAFLSDHASFSPEAFEGAQTGILQLLPHEHQLEGFFIARMRRCV